jgi:rSAM/selenodomain-associated transferase 1
VLLLVKYPEEGKVKRRLAKHIRGSFVVEIYRSFVLDVLSMLERSHIPFCVLFHPLDALEKFEGWLGTRYEYAPQIGGDLGERLTNGFTRIFAENVGKAIALASDVPDVSEEVLHEACAAFDESDAVIGPSPDGGYYLIGFQRATFYPDAFKQMAWGGNTVFHETRERLQNVKRKVHVLPLWRDIDTLDDLHAFVTNRNRQTYHASNTIRYLLRHKEIFSEKHRSSGVSNCQTSDEYR